MSYQNPNNNPYKSTHAPGGPIGPPSAPGSTKQSGVGIAGMILGIINGFATIVLFVAAGMMAVRAQETNGEMDEGMAMMVGLGLFAIIGMLLLGLVLSFIGLFMPRAKLCSILGLVFNLLIIFAIAGVMLLGMAAG